MRGLTAFAATLLAAATAVAQDGPSGQAMVQTCYVCHGPEGCSAEAVPAPMRGFGERKLEAAYARGWYRNISADSWG